MPLPRMRSALIRSMLQSIPLAVGASCCYRRTRSASRSWLARSVRKPIGESSSPASFPVSLGSCFGFHAPIVGIDERSPPVADRNIPAADAQFTGLKISLIFELYGSPNDLDRGAGVQDFLCLLA